MCGPKRQEVLLLLHGNRMCVLLDTFELEFGIAVRRGGCYPMISLMK